MKKLKRQTRNKELGMKYRKIREELDTFNEVCTQRKLSEILDIQVTQISALENGREPSLSELLAYCENLNIPMEYLVGLSNNRNYTHMKVGENLGLSDETIRCLKKWKKIYGDDSLVNVINCIFDSGYGEMLFKTLALYLFTEPQTFATCVEKPDDILKESIKSKKILVNNSGGMMTKLFVDDIPYLYLQAFMEKLSLMKAELQANGKIPKFNRETDWLINTHINAIKNKRRKYGKRTTKKK